jgi:hypothetical protein
MARVKSHRQNHKAEKQPAEAVDGALEMLNTFGILGPLVDLPQGINLGLELDGPMTVMGVGFDLDAGELAQELAAPGWSA